MNGFTNRDIRYFNIAKSVSECSDFKQFHIGAIIVYKKDILSVGFNESKTSPVQMKYNQYRNLDGKDNNCIYHKIHAEVNAISKIPYFAYENNFDFSKASIYIWRSHKSGTRGLSRPCPACMKAITDLGIKNIYYTGEDRFCYERIG